MTSKNMIVQQGQTLSQIAFANNTSVSKLCKINDIKNPNSIFVGQRIITDADTQNYKHEEKTLNIGGEIIGTGTAIEHLAPKSDLDKLIAARKELLEAQKANEVKGMSTSSKKYYNTKGPTAERHHKAFDNWQKVDRTYQESESLIKSEKELKVARKELHEAIKANEVKGMSTSSKKYYYTKGTTAERARKAYDNWAKADKAYDEAQKGMKNVKAIKTTRVLSKASKVIGKAATPLAVAAESYNVYTEYKKGGKKAAAKQAVRSSGAIAGAWAGAKGGAAVGAAIGSVFPGAGNAIGAAIGGVVGGVAGYLASDKIMKQIVK